MSLHNEVLRIMDFSSSYIDLAYAEANKKLSGTHMEVNGKINLVFKVSMGGLEVQDMYGSAGELDPDDVESLNVFLPETGIYVIKNNIIYLTKRAQRQWRKSYHPDIYRVINIFGSVGSNVVPYNLHNKTPVVMHYFNNGIYYLDRKVGQFTDGELSILDADFECETVTFMENNGYAVSV